MGDGMENNARLLPNEYFTAQLVFAYIYKYGLVLKDFATFTKWENSFPARQSS